MAQESIMTMDDNWRPPVGERVRLTIYHPNSGQAGTIVGHGMYRGHKAMLIRLDDDGRSVWALNCHEVKILAE